MPFYKFMDRKYVSSFADVGFLRLSKLSYFRQLEESSKSRWIGDRNEGILRYSDYSEVADFGEGDVPVLSPHMRALIGDPEPGQISGTVTFSGCTINVVADDHHIWCCSEGNLRELFEAMNSAGLPPEFRYNAAVEIVHPINIADALIKGVIVSPFMAPMKGIFNTVGLNSVEYSGHDREHDERGFETSVYIKDKFFEHQQEWRLRTKPARTDLPDIITVKIANPERVVRAVHLV